MKKTVAFGINDFTAGGAQRLIVDLCRLWSIPDQELHLITFFEIARPDFYSELPPSVTVHRLGFRNSRDIRAWIRLCKLLWAIRPNAVISHLFFSNMALRLMKPFFGYKISIVEHNTYIQKTKIQIVIDRLLSRITYRIIAVSKSVATFTSAQEKIPERKFAIIHNGIDIDAVETRLKNYKADQNLKTALGFEASDKIVLNVARLTPQKNHRLLINAFAEFAKRPGSERFKLVILGDGTLRPELEVLIASHGLEKKILLKGFQDPYPYYAVSDCFVSTSLIEGFGIAHVEALACGLPVLTTKTAGPDEIIVEGYNGYFISDTAIQAVAKDLEKMFGADTKEMRQHAMRSAQKFSIQKTTRSYEAHVAELLG